MLLLVTLKYHEPLEVVPERQDPEHKLLLQRVIELMNAGVIQLGGYERIHAGEIDNHCDTDTATDNETVIEVRLIVNEFSTDLNDGGEELYEYVLDDLELCIPNITYAYTCGEAPLQKTVIGIDVKYAPNPNVQYTDPDEIVYTQS